MSTRSGKKRPTIDPKRVSIGWKLLWVGFGLWLFGLFLDPISAPLQVPVPMSLRLDALFVVAIAQLAAVIFAGLWLWPIVRRHALRIWAIVLVVALVAMTSLYHIDWVQRLS